MGESGIGYKASEYYSSNDQHAFHKAVEKYTIFSLIGEATGLNVLDAGCGGGIYAREIIDRGAQHVMGVDCSGDFIEMARQKNEGYEGKIEYHQAFVQNFPGAGDKDLVIASYILSYPRTAEEAIAYCSAIGSHLKKGGRLIGFNNNNHQEFIGEKYTKYGFTKIMLGTTEGSEVHYNLIGMNNSIINFHLKPKTIEMAFEAAGFSEFRWERVRLDPSEVGNNYWDEFFDEEPPLVAMVAIK